MAVYGAGYAFVVFYDVFIEKFDSLISVLARVFGLQMVPIYVGIGARQTIDRYGQQTVAAASSFLFGLDSSGLHHHGRISNTS